MVDGQSADTDDLTVPSGRRLQEGRYLLVERLGHGGYGTVWRAHDRRIDREVAVKEFGLGAVSGATDDEAEFAEVRALEAAKCDAVVPVYDTFREDGQKFIVMRLVNGPTLARRLADGPMTPWEAAHMGLQLLDALEAAHSNGVLHRDLKPSNIMLEGDRALLTDFGIARLGPHGPEIGCPTLGYCAPEAAMPGGTYTAASDLWALGAVLQEAVTGRRAYPNFSAMLADLPSERHTPAERAGPLAEVIEGLLCHLPEERWAVDQTRAGLGSALVLLVDDTPTDPESLEEPRRVPVRPATAGGQLAKLQGVIRRRRAPLAVVTALLVVLVAVFSMSWPGAGSHGEQAPADWQRRSPGSALRPIEASLSIPPGFREQAVAGRWPEASYVKTPFRIQLRRQSGISDESVDEADKTVNNYRTRGLPGYGGTEEKISNVSSEPLATAEYHGHPGAVADIRYTDSGGKRWRLLEYFVVNGSGDCYRLQVAMPPNDPQSTQGETIFNTVRRSLELDGF